MQTIQFKDIQTAVTFLIKNKYNKKLFIKKYIYIIIHTHIKKYE